ncbi:winged helix DNA-binding domain protein [Leptospira fainei serovar Hurstbridge str. BUT 6]|uniref:Winged helix DNA-binding domain protein n=1 Tax=Leptospira fainei serovar Hurstbridge str. BUT 6 TaxID=1193011 RepID=S3V131_9LEPT|nr:winged helix DNA-binding domain-containing protein [Leptospira fainei]EPG75153.1 winged helix DNA-binding domain protein [Leptospira fainei serovar Hurstbridge str. BUT 6]
MNISMYRLYQQEISGTRFKKAEEVTAWMGALQAQDRPQAKLAIRLRGEGIRDADVETAILKKKIVRTWSLRGTLHFLSAADIHWIVSLLGPKIVAGLAGQHRKLELDLSTFNKSNTILSKILRNGEQLTRKELFEEFEKKGISVEGIRGAHLLYQAALTGLICQGPMKGRQETFVLLQEWIPKRKGLDREEALSALAKRYFTGHGPATIQDFIWWAGLTLNEGKIGLASVQSELSKVRINDKDYWSPSFEYTNNIINRRIYLLPGFDEFLLGYEDRSFCVPSQFNSRVVSNNGFFYPIILLDGQAIGTWKRIMKKDSNSIETNLFFPLDKPLTRILRSEIERYRDFYF